MKRFISVAAIQMEILPLAVDANLAKAELLIQNAVKAQKLDLVVLPEDCITGPIPYNLEYSLDDTSDAVLFFRNLARKYKLYLVCGSFIKKREGKYFNTALLIDRTGEIILEYEKNNLWIPERRYLAPGTNLPVVKTDIGTIGLTICWDLASPNIFQTLARQEADIICCPSYWTVEDAGLLIKKYPNVPIEANLVDTLCAARAMENEVLLIYANGAKKADLFLKSKKISHRQIGHSQICAAILGSVKKISTNREGFVSYTYDRLIAKHAERNYKLRQDLANGNTSKIPKANNVVA